MALALDYSADSPPSASVVKALGYVGVIRYVTPGRSKSIKRPEYQEMIGHGINVGLVYEGGVDDWRDGQQAGADRAKDAMNYAGDILGIVPRCIYMAVDWDVQPNEYAELDAYFRGARSTLGLGRTGMYGSTGAVSRAASQGLAAYRWQAAAWGGDPLGSSHLYQHIPLVTVDGVECDVSTVLKSDFGQTQSNVIVPPKPPVPVDDDVLAWAAMDAGYEFTKMLAKAF